MFTLSQAWLKTMSSTHAGHYTLPVGKNVLNIKNSKKMKLYIEQAEKLLMDPTVASIKLIGVGNVIPKVVSITEIIKRLHPDLQQKSTLQQAPHPDKRPPKRIMSCLIIELIGHIVCKDVEMAPET